MAELLVAIFLLSACAAFVQRVSGFGFGIFIMMFLPHIMPSYNEAVALSGLLSGSTALFILLRNFGYVRWRKMGLVFLSNAFVSFFVINFMLSFSSELLRTFLGVALILVSLYFFFFESRIKGVFTSCWSQCAVGAVSGVMGAMFGMPGPPVVLYGINAINDKKEYMATMQAFWLSFNLVYLCFRSGGGYYTSSTPHYLAIGAAGVLLGLFFGNKMFNAINGRMFKFVVYSIMFLSGVAAFFR